ncbi:alpha/beta fold hydrolase [Sciscionella sediminilitoris]|uniref:alpha/beta fold hydrolase n=1 Tax=Sciscionella sediminilitoris TaxID=1445613 RepID=UPI0018D19871|nr:alpha/beta hydrolase [Sciscionella sp. SE31]
MNDLVCLHAAASSPATWDRIRPGLHALGYRVHCPVLPGHRGAQRLDSYPPHAFRDAVLEDLDRRGVERFALIGHSLGAFAATLLAAKQPERVTHLILEEMPVPPRDHGDRPPSRKPAAGTLLRTLARLRRDRFDPAMLDEVLTGLREPQPQWWTELALLSAPALILAGGDTSHLDQNRHRLIAETVPDATLRTVEAGHRIHSRAPKTWLFVVTEFLSGDRTL